MTSLEKSLDEIIGESKDARPPKGPRGSRDRGSSKSNRVGKGTPRSSRVSRAKRGPPPPRTNPEAERLADGRDYLRLKNLNFQITEKDLHQLFERIAPVLFVHLDINPHTGDPTGVGYLCYEEPSFNNQAIEQFNGKLAAGRIMVVEHVHETPLSERIGVSSRPKGPKGAKKNGPKKVRQPSKNAEDLDKELEDYMGSRAENSKDEEPSGATGEAFPAVSTGDGMALD
ncbi:hypothetical protein KP2612_001494 [Komagataella phaffii]|uniref:RRM domain-containing protein n=2 Tax=Komagataella phaffii TaxID=460519 RepID=C4QZ01_KOMPG|nr:Hypothetical protein PAS_chr1-4_0616 [Komagataella phaffii GS115]KAI0464167.1 hypothetical protein LJB42_001770 [Komagataella kurtzmanii]CAY68475.1 Hypothetical protein PAS_chr1-4_0616 [Komagataella phaffii GS115]